MTTSKSHDKIILNCSKKGDLTDLKELFYKYGDGLLTWRLRGSGETLLLLCARYGQYVLLKYLIPRCVQTNNLEQRNTDGKRALHEAVLHGHLQCVQLLIEHNVTIDCLKRADWTPLMLACTKNNKEIITELLTAGSDPKLVNKDGWNCFHIAVREGHVTIVQYLLDVSPNLWNTISNNGRTPLHTAALHGHLEIVQLLLERCDYQRDCVDTCGTTPIMDAVRAGHVQIASVLLTKQVCQMKTRDYLGRQCVHLAAQAGSLNTLIFCINERHDEYLLDDKDVTGMTALHLAAKEGHTEIISFLLDQGSRVNDVDNNKRTALHLACAAGQTRAVLLLLSSPHVDISLCDIIGKTAKTYVSNSDMEILREFHTLE